MSEHRFQTPKPVKLELRLAAGSVNVASVVGDESVVTLEGPPRAVEETRIELVGDRLIVEERRKGLMGLFAGIGEPMNVTVQVPHGSRVDAATAASRVHLDGNFGAVSMASASGDLDFVGELDGDADVKTASGSVRVPHVGGDLRVKTVSGDVSAESVDGSVSVKSVSGDLYVGSVTRGKVDVHNVAGDVTLGIAPGSSIDVDAGSASGDLSSEIPLSAKAPAGEGPTVVIRVQTVSGDLLVRRAG
jgi:hypothetical protein